MDLEDDQIVDRNIWDSVGWQVFQFHRIGRYVRRLEQDISTHLGGLIPYTTDLHVATNIYLDKLLIGGSIVEVLGTLDEGRFRKLE